MNSMKVISHTNPLSITFTASSTFLWLSCLLLLFIDSVLSNVVSTPFDHHPIWDQRLHCFAWNWAVKINWVTPFLNHFRLYASGLLEILLLASQLSQHWKGFLWEDVSQIRQHCLNYIIITGNRRTLSCLEMDSINDKPMQGFFRKLWSRLSTSSDEIAKSIIEGVVGLLNWVEFNKDPLIMKLFLNFEGLQD